MSPMLIAPLSIEIQTILMKHTISSSSDWLSLARCSKLRIQRKLWNMVNSVQGLNFLLRVKHPSVRLSRQKYEIIPNHFPHYKAARSYPSPSPAITPLPHRTSQTFKPLQQQDRQRLPFFSVSVGQVAVTGLLEKFLLAVGLWDLGNDTILLRKWAVSCGSDTLSTHMKLTKVATAKEQGRQGTSSEKRLNTECFGHCWVCFFKYLSWKEGKGSI